MSQGKRSSRKRAISPVHPHAAAVDIGATLHVAAVGPDRDPEPVRSFGTFTADLHRLADWFEHCGVKTVAMESTGVYWICTAPGCLDNRLRYAARLMVSSCQATRIWAGLRYPFFSISHSAL